MGNKITRTSGVFVLCCQGSAFEGSGNENYSDISKVYYPRCTIATGRVPLR